MATPTKTQEFIATAAGIYRAIGELANVASRHGQDAFKRQAAKAEDDLQKTLDAEIRGWNDYADELRVTLCAHADSWAVWARREKCEIYTAASSGVCDACAALKAAYDEKEAA
jgi:hypothetical protein